MRKSLISLGLLAGLAILVAGCGGSSTTSSTPGTATGASGSSSTPTSPSSSSGTTGSAAAKSLEQSLLHFGSQASGSEKAAVSAAAHSFFTALASRDSAKVCEGITSSSRAQIQAFLKSSSGAYGKKVAGKSCAAGAKTLFLTQENATRARLAAKGSVSAVRVQGETAYFLFRPAGGQLSYFVMKREKGAWKAVSPNAGTPVNPLPTTVR